ncbi:hypothetical protein [Microbulbifer mangrovi]|uniref:hypothetical protein n=1 Tax=Microbulbifer mangrovi TaxID=927787 RepID=UPI00117C6EA3|nr:hypothetical protein [Microbulbifer mangrovi]
MSFRVRGWGSVGGALRSILLLSLLSPTALLYADEVDTDTGVSSAALASGSHETDADSRARNSENDGGPELLDAAVQDRIATSELVAQVKITGVHRMIDNALSEPGMVAILGYVYSGVTEKIWKGAPTNLVAFRLTLDDCDRKLERGEHYLIFAKVDTQGRLQLASCEAAVAGADAAGLLGQLDRYYQG